MASNFDIIIDRIPFSADKANILHNLKLLKEDDDINSYKKFVVDNYYKGNPLSSSLFYEELCPEITDIHERISYTKHNRVIRNGAKCKYCKGNNTFSEDKRKGGGDEYIPTRVVCYDCNKEYIS